MNLPARLGLRRALSGALVVAGALAASPLPASATTIERIVSPSGIVAWLVREPSVPLIALDFAFKGGATQDPVDKAGVATMTAALLDEGAGDIDSKSFHERVEAKALGDRPDRRPTGGANRDHLARQAPPGLHAARRYRRLRHCH